MKLSEIIEKEKSTGIQWSNPTRMKLSDLQKESYKETPTSLPPMEIRNPATASLKAASEFIPGTQFATEYWSKGGPFRRQALTEAMESVKPIEEAQVKGLPAQLSYGAKSAAPLLLGTAQPFMAGAGRVLGAASKVPGIGRIASMPLARTMLGFGAYEGARNLAGGQIQNVPEAIKGGALSGATYHLGSHLGSTLAQPLSRLTSQSQRIGSALGAGGVSAAMAPEGEKLSSGIMGGAFGVKYPTEPFGYKSPAKLINEATNIYRKVLKPAKGDIKNIEVRKGENIDDFYRLASKEKLPIYQTKDDSPKLDTTKAIDILNEKISKNHKKMRERLSQDTTKRFDLEQVRNKVKQNLERRIDNATELETSSAEVDAYINSEVVRHGRYVDASTIDSIKSGMWGVGYKHLTPTSKANARRIGLEIKDIIDSTYADKNIRSINQKTHELSTLRDLMANAHGKVVSRGKIGNYVGAAIGGMAGMAAEGLIPIPGLETIAGAALGKKISSYLASPERQTKVAFGKVKKAEQMAIEPILDRFGRVIAQRVQHSEVREPMAQFAFGQAGLTPEQKAGATDVVFRDPKQLPAPQKQNPYQKLLPGKGQYGQSSGPVIQGQPQLKLPAPKQRPVFGQLQTPEVIQPPNLQKKITYRSPEAGAKLKGEGFDVTIGKQSKGTIAKSKAKILRSEKGEAPILKTKSQLTSIWNKAKGIKDVFKSPMGIAAGLGTALASGGMARNAQASIQDAENSKSTDVSSKGAVGIRQITQPALTEYNKAHKTNYVIDDMKDDVKAKEVGDWYENVQIPKELTSYGLKTSKINKIIAYNAGASKAKDYNKLPKETVNYIIKNYEKDISGISVNKGVDVFDRKRKDAQNVQKFLKAKGYYDGNIDNIWGPKSKAAFIKWLNELNK